MTRPAATPTVQIDDGTIRVTRWDFGVDAETGEHTHAYPYIVVPVATGDLMIESADGVITSPLVIGESYHRPAGATHNVVNASGVPFSFVEIELLDSPGAG